VFDFQPFLKTAATMVDERRERHLRELVLDVTGMVTAALKRASYPIFHGRPNGPTVGRALHGAAAGAHDTWRAFGQRDQARHTPDH
jgi:hypothetical protein